MGLNTEYIDGQTPMEEQEKQGLLIPTIATRGELDEFEQQNIEQAILWTLTHRFKPSQIFTQTFIKELHIQMYGGVWHWAGQFRKTNKNLGIDKSQIPIALKTLLDDVQYWLKHNTYPAPEIAIRFKHRLVSIHCFPNGNGRHSRLMADIIIEQIFSQPAFSWGAGSIASDSLARATYIAALKAADRGDYTLLLDFAKA